MQFIDEYNNKYKLTLGGQPSAIMSNVIKLRCVDVNTKNDKFRTIKLTRLSSCLILPKYFYDSRKFNKLTTCSKSLNKQHSQLAK